MSFLTISIPDNVNLDPKDTVKFLSAKLYEAGKVSLGQAAELCGMSKVSFAEIIGEYGVSLINYPVAEMIQDATRI